MAERRSGSRGRDGRPAGSSARRRVDSRTGRRPESRSTDRRRTSRADDDTTGVVGASVPETVETRERSRSLISPRRRLPASWDGVSVGGLGPKRAIILALVVSAVALTLAVPLRTYFAQRSEAEQLRTANEAIRRDVTSLQKKVDEQNDPSYIEEQARSRLLMVRPGETPLVMQFPAPPEKSDDEKRAERQATNPWYTNLFDAVSTPAGQ